MAKVKKKQEKKSFVDYVESDPIFQPITETIETNYMPYAVSVMVSRAIPEIDGFKPAHRKLLYTMYKMGLMHGHRTKSANIVGETMKLNPHGDMSIYETMVRLTKGNEALLHPFVDSKGSFGKQYSRDMAFAASRYTEAKLDQFCAEIFGGIDKDAVEMIDNYDSTTKEPRLLPTSFPNILVSPNLGIAVGLASSICSFNLAEVCDATIAILRSPKCDIEKIMDILKAPDFPGGANVIYDREQIKKVYETGKGPIKLRAKYVYNEDDNSIEILEIPYSTSIEAITKEITDMFKEGKLKEITDFRDEIDRNGFKFTIDLRKGTDPEQLMQKLFKFTPLEDNFPCNFNVIIGGAPKQLGVKEILVEWIKFRTQCLTREFRFDLDKKSKKLHLLLGLGKILLDIDKAVKIVRETEKDDEVVPNLMVGFNVDKEQAEYIADIKLRHLNREYIMNRLADIDELRQEIQSIKDLLADELKMKSFMIKQLSDIKKKYGKPRKTNIIDASEIKSFNNEIMIEDYTARLFFTKDGYLKKITQQSLRGNSEQKFKDGDKLILECDISNKDELIFFTDKCQLYFAKMSDFELSKASDLGVYVPKQLDFEPDEKVAHMEINPSFSENQRVIFVFENGKAVRVPMCQYETQGNRKKLKKAYSDVSKIAGIIYEKSDDYFMIINSEKKAILIRPSIIPIKTTRTSQGTTVFAMNLKKKQKVTKVLTDFEKKYPEAMSTYRKIKIPATGVLMEKGSKR
ncbi:MAG: topoisomerase IV [Clostridia bacterium]|nr:topoisomerase IV [Clostridia bacterium]